MAAPRLPIPLKQQRILAELKRVYDAQGSQWIDFHDLVAKVGMPQDEVSRTLGLLNGKGLVEWHTFSATPGSYASEGTITSPGYDLAYSFAWTTRLLRFGLPLVSAFASSAVAAVANYLISPQGLPALVGAVASGTIAGTFLVSFSLRRLLG